MLLQGLWLATYGREAHDVDFRGRDLHQLQTKAPADGQTRIATMSWRQSTRRVGHQIAERGIDKGNEAPLVKDINDKLAADGKPPLDVTTPKGAAQFRAMVSGELYQLLKQPEPAQRLQAAKNTTTAEVARARAAGILPMVAAGNARSDDDKTSGMSNFGAKLVTNGSQMPIGNANVLTGQKGLPVDEGGTSFSMPYADGVGALAIKANPKLSVDQLVKCPRWVHWLPRRTGRLRSPPVHELQHRASTRIVV